MQSTKPPYTSIRSVPAGAILGNSSGATAAAQALDASTVRTVIGLGTAATAAAGDFEPAGSIAALSSVYQPLDSDLTAIAALTTTTFGRALLALADAAAGRNAFGLGTAAVAASSDFAAAVHAHTFDSLTSKPTTLSGYGITDAQPLATGLTSLAAASTIGMHYLSAANTWSPVSIGSGLQLSAGTLSSTVSATSPGGSSGELQYNNAGAFGGAAGLSWNSSRLQLGGVTLAYPAIKRNGTGIDIRLADDSAYAPITSAQLNPGTAADVSIGGSAGADMFHAWVSSNAGVLGLRSNGLYGLTNSATNAGGAVDIALGRNAAGVAEINNGSAGAYRDLYLQSLVASQNITVGSGYWLKLANASTALTASADGAMLLSTFGSSTTLRIQYGGTSSAFPMTKRNGTDLEVRLADDSALTTLAAIVRPAAYTFATVPTASSNTGSTIRITDRSNRQAYSDGTNWRFVADDAIIS